jgi:tetratricopeptide (TPR) repeat protein
MGLFDWLGGGNKAMALYKKGMEKAKKRDHAGAIQDYTAAIDQPHASSEVLAMTRYNRALVYAAMGDNVKAEADLNEVLAAPEQHANIKAMAKQKLARMGTRSRITGK